MCHLGFCSCPIFICTADIDAIIASRSAESGVTVCAEHAANDVAQMRYIVHIGQRAGNENVSLPCNTSSYHQIYCWKVERR